MEKVMSDIDGVERAKFYWKNYAKSVEGLHFYSFDGVTRGMVRGFARAVSAAFGVSQERVLVDALAVNTSDAAQVRYYDSAPRELDDAISHFSWSMRYPYHYLTKGAIDGFCAVYGIEDEDVLEAFEQR